MNSIDYRRQTPADARRAMSATIGGVLRTGTFPLLLSTAAAAMLYATVGASLGLYLGALLLLTALAPTIGQAEWRTREQLAVLILVALPFVVAFLVTTAARAGDSYVKVGEAVACALTALAYAAALAGVSIGLRAIRVAGPIAAGVSVIAGLFWLTWPIWMSRNWAGQESAQSVATVARFNPAMVVDGQLNRAFGPWTKQSVAYHLTELNQAVAYSAPKGIGPTLALHGAIALGGFVLSALLTRRPTPSDIPTMPTDGTPNPSTAPDSSPELNA